jgi:hypothetical protein
MMLTQQTFLNYGRHIADAPGLYTTRSAPVKLSDGTWRNENLTTDPSPALAAFFDHVVLPRAIKAERAALRRCDKRYAPRKARAPFWMTLPVQMICCVLWVMWFTLLCLGYVAFGVIALIAEGVCVIARGARWALSC